MNKTAILLSTLFAAGASAQAGTLGARAFQPGQPGLEEAGCGANKTEGKGEKQSSCGANGCGATKTKEGEAGKKAGAEKSCGGDKAKAPAKEAPKTPSNG